MRHVLLLVTALAAFGPTTVTLQIRVFDGPEDVSSAARVVVFKAGDRQHPVAQSAAGGLLEAPLPEGLYDAQAIHEAEGRVMQIRWAERLVLMAYPDEEGRHLEIINFQSDYGALQARGRGAGTPDVDIFAAGARDHEAAHRIDGPDYALFVVKAGVYDLRVRRDGEVKWHAGIEVPLDRTRFWVVPQ
jgi:hypothetical protein